MTGRMRNDPELVFWRGQDESWNNSKGATEAVSWEELHVACFPEIERLRNAQAEADKADKYS